MLLLLNARNHLVGIRTFEGSVGSASVYPREIVTAAIMYGATSAVFVHNHPSGHPEPSPQDIAMTRKIWEALDSIDVSLHDHIIVDTGTSSGAYVSLAELKLVPRSTKL
jgi:DNA repair protein RadC